MNASQINSRLNAKTKTQKEFTEHEHEYKMNWCGNWKKYNNNIVFFLYANNAENIVLNCSMEAVLELPTFWNRATMWTTNFLFYYTMTWKKKKQIWGIIGTHNSRTWIPMRGWKRRWKQNKSCCSSHAEPHIKVFTTLRFQRLHFGSWQGVTATTTFKMSYFRLPGWDSVFLKQVYEWKGRNREDPQVLMSTD